jgi:spore germination cell wall hydrolase CwlJ-like protein
MTRILACLFGLSIVSIATNAAAMNWAVAKDKVECLALAIYWEARSESADDQSAVAHVAVNRASHPQFPDDVCAVVKQGGAVRRGKCQFSWWCDGRDDTPREPQAWQAALDRAEAVLEGDSEDPTGGAVYFHHKRVRPKWSAVKERTTEIGKHVFYR